MELSWEQLGIDKEGTTESLVSDVEIIKAFSIGTNSSYLANLGASRFRWISVPQLSIIIIRRKLVSLLCANREFG